MLTLNHWTAKAVSSLLLVLACISGAVAEQPSLNIIPADAPLVVSLNNSEKTRTNLVKFLANALPDRIVKPFAAQFDTAMGQLAPGRDLKEVRKDSPVFMVVSDLKSLGENEPRLTYLIPVKSYEAFKDGLLKPDERKSLTKEADGIDSVKFAGNDNPRYLVDLTKYVAVASDKEAAKSFIGLKNKGLATTISKDCVDAFFKQDVAVYLNLRTLDKDFGAKIRFYKVVLAASLKNSGIGFDKLPKEKVAKLLNDFTTFLEDSIALVAGVEIRPEGCTIHLTVQFRPETTTNSYLKEFKRGPLNELGSLPVERAFFNYSAKSVDPKLSSMFGSSSAVDGLTDTDEEARKTIGDALQELRDNRSQVGMATSTNGGFKVWQYEDGVKAVSTRLKMLRAATRTAALDGMPLNAKPEITENAESIGDIKFHRVKLSFDLDKLLETIPEAARDEAKAFLGKQYGDQPILWFGNSGNKAFEYWGRDWNKAKSAINNYMKGTNTLGADEGFILTRKNLPADASYVQIVNAPLMIEVFSNTFVEALRQLQKVYPIKLPKNLPDIVAPTGKSSFVGSSTTVKPEHFSTEFFIPAKTVEQVREMLMPLIDSIERGK